LILVETKTISSWTYSRRSTKSITKWPTSK